MLLHRDGQVVIAPAGSDLWCWALLLPRRRRRRCASLEARQVAAAARARLSLFSFLLSARAVADLQLGRRLCTAPWSTALRSRLPPGLSRKRRGPRGRCRRRRRSRNVPPPRPPPPQTELADRKRAGLSLATSGSVARRTAAGKAVARQPFSRYNAAASGSERLGSKHLPGANATPGLAVTGRCRLRMGLNLHADPLVACLARARDFQSSRDGPESPPRLLSGSQRPKVVPCKAL